MLCSSCSGGEAGEARGESRLGGPGMKFRELAEVFGRLQLSTGRLGAVRIVADLLGRAFIEELEPMVYLLQGQLRPA